MLRFLLIIKMQRLFGLSNMSVIVPYYGSEIDIYTFMWQFNKQTWHVIHNYPDILGSNYRKLDSYNKRLFIRYIKKNSQIYENMTFKFSDNTHGEKTYTLFDHYDMINDQTGIYIDTKTHYSRRHNSIILKSPSSYWQIWTDKRVMIIKYDDPRYANQPDSWWITRINERGYGLCIPLTLWGKLEICVLLLVFNRRMKFEAAIHYST